MPTVEIPAVVGKLNVIGLTKIFWPALDSNHDITTHRAVGVLSVGIAIKTLVKLLAFVNCCYCQNVNVMVGNKKLCYCRETARHATSVEILWPFSD